MVDRRKLLTRLAGLFGIGMAASQANAKGLLSAEEIVKAWQDPSFRNSLSKEQWDALPPNPAGEVRSGQFKGDLQMASGNNCSGNNCSGNNCSGNNCSGNSCSGNNCSGNNCSGNGCSGNNCSGNNCSGNNCSGNRCSG
jgi:mersacidin/lichenicidin family type 2 lantibiotic